MGRRRTRKTRKFTAAKPKRSVGGLAFFISYICLALLMVINVRTLPQLWDSTAYENFLYAISGLSLGSWFAYIFIHGRLNVFIHEFKHALLSGLVGNKAGKLEIEKESGLFTYKHTAENEKYNALISLAPYFFPLCSILATIFALLFFRETHQHIVLIICIGFGCDLLMNFRDAQPHQTDITEITGGYSVGYTFIILMNVNIAIFLGAWVLQESYGLKLLAATLWEFGVHLFWYFRSIG